VTFSELAIPPPSEKICPSLSFLTSLWNLHSFAVPIQGYTRLTHEAPFLNFSHPVFFFFPCSVFTITDWTGTQTNSCSHPSSFLAFDRPTAFQSLPEKSAFSVTFPFFSDPPYFGARVAFYIVNGIAVLLFFLPCFPLPIVQLLIANSPSVSFEVFFRCS